jgi:hypothetical protein
MAVVRRNILTDAVSMQKFREGINLLKKDFSAGVTTQTPGSAVRRSRSALTTGSSSGTRWQ